MAIRFTLPVRPALLLVALAATAVVAPALASASPNAKPTVTSVQKQLGQLVLENSQLVEKFDHARVVLAKRNQQAVTAQLRSARAHAAYVAAHAAFAHIIQAQYETGSMDPAGALLDSDSGSNYLDRLDTMNLLSQHDAEVVSNVASTRKTADAEALTAVRLRSDAQTRRDALAKQRRTVAASIEKYKTLLAKLKSAQRAAYLAQLNPAVPVDTTQNLPVASSHQAQTAVEFALAQVGKPYVFGTAGPSTYDCSGLTMAAWAAAGVSLPHSAADQYNYGHHVLNGQVLEPGDLLFFYSPIGHVTIYIGNGLMVSAPTEGEPVAVVPLAYFRSDYVGATRL